jgi:predicted unusual protein kinase regulating ubiquinone biosynthesis (AarF/ABC1/UbiB family)
MKTIDKIPTNKIDRASLLVKTGFKVGGNYIAYYGEKIINPSLNKDKLNENNAEDIYDGLKNLKGSALKVAQMLSMDKSIMPQQYVEKFSLSQFSVPPLSAPLVRKTFKKYFGQYPELIRHVFARCYQCCQYRTGTQSYQRWEKSCCENSISRRSGKYKFGFDNG